MKRKAISKKVRFEVFKRDSFKCQYCGKSAPGIVLHVDHIDPVSKGGCGDIMNLITSCIDCNLGKSDRELSDSSVVEKQRKQLQDLNERREQIEMMLAWRDAMQEMKKDVVDLVVGAINKEMDGESVNDTGRASVKRWLKKFTVEELLDAIELSADRYLRGREVSCQDFFSYIPKRAAVERRPESERLALYCRGVLRNRVSYVNQSEALSLINGAVEAGYTIESITDFVKGVNTWTQFRAEMLRCING